MNTTLLMVNTSRGFIGGVERFLHQICISLKKNGWSIIGLFEHQTGNTDEFDKAFDHIDMYNEEKLPKLIDKYKKQNVKLVMFHKVNSALLISSLQHAFRTICLVHDHDYYCLRKHKYFPINRINCELPFTILGCTICSGLLQKNNTKITVLPIRERYRILSCIRNCDKSLVLSDYMKHNLFINGWASHMIQKIHPFIELLPYKEQLSSDKTCPTILYVGQLVRGKGVDLLLKALTYIKENFVCKIVGKGNDEARLKQLTIDYEISEEVEWCGWSCEVHQFYSQADIVVVPSLWQEPFGLVGLEAFAHRKPVVAFKVGGISEWLKHRVNGLAVRPRCPQRLAKAIEILLNNPNKASTFGEAGYTMVKNNYSEEVFLKEFETVCKPLIN